MNLLDKFQESAKELRNISTIVMAGILMGLNLALKSITIAVTSFLKIGFAFLTNAVCGMLYGPVVAGLMAGAGDVVGFLFFNPTGQPFSLGFTFNAVLGGVIYGLFFYGHKITFQRAFLAKLVVSVLVNLFFGTLWNAVLYHQAIVAMLPLRALKEIIKCPIDAFLIYFVAKAIVRIRVPGKVADRK